MNEVAHHPATGNLLFCLLACWPLMRIFARTGLNRFWSLLIFANLLLPFLGIALTAGMLGHRTWPSLPTPPKPQKPQKKDWGKA